MCSWCSSLWIATPGCGYIATSALFLPPASQRTLRELEVGRTLVKDRQGRWVIRHGPGDYKVGLRGGVTAVPALVAARVQSRLSSQLARNSSVSPSQTGRAYGERPPLTLSPHIYPELEAFMDKWRAALQPRHNLLFTQ